MSKLHIYRKIHNDWWPQADGDGELSQNEEFEVTLTSGSVSKGTTYQIRKGQAVDGGLYNCKKDANGRGKVIEFMFAGVASSSDQEQLAAAARILTAALLATKKQVTIEVATEDLTDLELANYRLCFAKKVGNEDYNVVWQSYSEFLLMNEFSWTPQYQIFGSNVFQSEVTVKVSTNLMNMGLGELSVLDEFGIIGPPKTGGPATSLNLDNQYGSVHPGVNQLSTGIDGKVISTPIYVAVNPIVKGTVSLTPVEKVLVWFEQNIATSTMFSSARSKEVEIDLTSISSATRLYTDHSWITP